MVRLIIDAELRADQYVQAGSTRRLPVQFGKPALRNGQSGDGGESNVEVLSRPYALGLGVAVSYG